MDWVTIVQQLGFPIAVCAALLAGIWRAARWCAARADKLVDAHLAFLTGLETVMRQMGLDVTSIREKLGGDRVPPAPGKTA